MRVCVHVFVFVCMCVCECVHVCVCLCACARTCADSREQTLQLPQSYTAGTFTPAGVPGDFSTQLAPQQHIVPAAY